MKTFANRIVAVCSICLLLGFDATIENGNGVVAIAAESSLSSSSSSSSSLSAGTITAHLRRSIGIQHQQQRQEEMRRFLDKDDDNGKKDKEPSDVSNKENQMDAKASGNGKDSEGSLSTSEETKELKDIEEEFDGNGMESSSSKETNDLEEIEKEFDGMNEKDSGNNEEKETTTKEETASGNKTDQGESPTPKTGNNNKQGGGDNAKEETVDAKEETEVPATAEPTPSPVATQSPVQSPVAAPTVKPYAKSDDTFDPIKAQDEKHDDELELQELETELKQEEKVARQAGGFGLFLGILAMIFTAHQMSENPDGIYASVCRLAITISSVAVKIVCMPCRKLVGGGSGGGGSGNPYSGHMPISTNDYSYRNDPYRSNANAGFELS
uniref:Uncharacterized protein n=1 Tax=Pseudo-nitzschia australis TaxID=44445 RepID=A0A7S4EI70_9STRA